MARYVSFTYMPDELKNDEAFDAGAYVIARFDEGIADQGLEKNEPWTLSWSRQTHEYEDVYKWPKRAWVWIVTKVAWRARLRIKDPRTYHTVVDWAVRGVTDIDNPELDERLPNAELDR